MRTGPSRIGSVRSAGAAGSASARVVVLGSADSASPASSPVSSLIEPLSLATCSVPFFCSSFFSSSASWASRQSRSQSSSAAAVSVPEVASPSTLADGPCSVSVSDGSPPSCSLSSRSPFGFTRRGCLSSGFALGAESSSPRVGAPASGSFASAAEAHPKIMIASIARTGKRIGLRMPAD